MSDDDIANAIYARSAGEYSAQDDLRQQLAANERLASELLVADEALARKDALIKECVNSTSVEELLNSNWFGRARREIGNRGGASPEKV